MREFILLTKSKLMWHSTTFISTSHVRESNMVIWDLWDWPNILWYSRNPLHNDSYTLKIGWSMRNWNYHVAIHFNPSITFPLLDWPTAIVWHIHVLIQQRLIHNYTAHMSRHMLEISAKLRVSYTCSSHNAKPARNCPIFDIILASMMEVSQYVSTVIRLVYLNTASVDAVWMRILISPPIASHVQTVCWKRWLPQHLLHQQLWRTGQQLS